MRACPANRFGKLFHVEWRRRIRPLSGRPATGGKPPMRQPPNRLALLLLTLALALSACGEEKKTAAAPPPPAVGVSVAAMKGVSRADQFVGRIQAVGIVG